MLTRISLYQRFHWTYQQIQDTPAEELAALHLALPQVEEWQSLSDEERWRLMPPGINRNPQLDSKNDRD